MAKQIFKYELLRREHTLELPFGVNIIHFGMQRNKACFWAEVDPEETRKVNLVITPKITGAEVPGGVYNGDILVQGYRYLGTALYDNGDFVLHYYFKEE